MTVRKWKKPVWKAMLYIISTTWHFGGGMATIKGHWFPEVWVERWIGRRQREDFKGSENTLYDITMGIIILLSKPSKCTASRVNPKVNYRLRWLWCVNEDPSLGEKKIMYHSTEWCW